MRIVQLIPELNQGGVERVVAQTTEGFVQRGHEVIVISNGGTLVSSIEQCGGKHIQLDLCSKNLLSFFPRVLKLKSLLVKWSPDILHAHSRVPAWLAYFANKQLKIPFVTTVHGFNSVSDYSKIMTLGDRVICVSNPVKAYIQQHYQTADEKIAVIHPGVDPNQFNPDNVDHAWIAEFKNKHDLNGKKLITSVGRITDLKDFPTFIKAIGLYRKENSNTVGLIVGNVRADKQKLFNELKQLVSDLHLQNHFRFITEGARMPEIYTLSDVIVSCSKKPESFGLTLVEALAMNTPVIATRHGGPLDIIQEGVNGLFFDPEHTDELAKKLQSHSSIQSINLREQTLQRFSMIRMIEATEAIYKQTALFSN
jgi:glycosyltransferase involved in cell wall biosynthesis